MTDTQKQFIIDNYATMDNAAIYQHTGLKKTTVKNFVTKEKLRKAPILHLEKKDEIAAKYASVPTVQLAAEYGTTIEAIKFIAHKAGVTRRIPKRIPTSEDVVKILQLRAKGLTQHEIRNEMHMRLSFIRDIIEKSEEQKPQKELVFTTDGKHFCVEKYSQIFAI